MLDTRFPRPRGDVGHPDTFPVPVRRRVVPGAFPRAVVASAAALRASGLAERFSEALRALEAEGARALTTSCGFLVLLQRELQAAVRVPLVSSTLLQLPQILEREAEVGVLTISAEHLGEEHLLAAGVPPDRLRDVRVQGMDPRGPFARTILGDLPEMDLAAARADVVAAALSLRRRAPGLRTLVLECTNMPPHAEALADATGWRVRTLLDAGPLLQWPHA
ncbi:aspartate/glutamate racemase family protein [Ramlibacter pallidus]|uniref:Aspartate/glutamate racemase family protein n=1 Tax=Ramlibacter pallidus TaxID=2780087 RepID=A0ABR9S962_9BURK|nr:aspartate/glutamate racemase family protein [Ramlibacter pallidus]MBE7369944.1 aspartate/glutamate racemase family protein [Ramlibacter pallidus]